MPIHITGSGATDIGLARAILIQCNKDLTGTITVTNAGSTQYGTASGTIAIVTNPTAAGSPYKIRGLHTLGNISVNPSGSGDVTVSKLNTVT